MDRIKYDRNISDEENFYNLIKVMFKKENITLRRGVLMIDRVQPAPILDDNFEQVITDETIVIVRGIPWLSVINHCSLKYRRIDLKRWENDFSFVGSEDVPISLQKTNGNQTDEDVLLDYAVAYTGLPRSRLQVIPSSKVSSNSSVRYMAVKLLVEDEFDLVFFKGEDNEKGITFTIEDYTDINTLIEYKELRGFSQPYPFLNDLTDYRDLYGFDFVFDAINTKFENISETTAFDGFRTSLTNINTVFTGHDGLLLIDYPIPDLTVGKKNIDALVVLKHPNDLGIVLPTVDLTVGKKDIDALLESRTEPLLIQFPERSSTP